MVRRGRVRRLKGELTRCWALETVVRRAQLGSGKSMAFHGLVIMIPKDRRMEKIENWKDDFI